MNAKDVIRIFEIKRKKPSKADGWYFKLLPAGAWEPILVSARYESAERAYEVAVNFNRVMYPPSQRYTVRKPRSM